MSETTQDDHDDLFDEEEWADIADDPELTQRVIEAVSGMIPGILKKAATSGVGNLLSEDGLRAMLSENKKLPKEAVNLVVSQADSMRREILRIISREIRVFLENMDFGGEIAKILTSVSFEIKTEIRFIPNDQAVKPQIKNKIKAKRSKEDEEADEGEDSSSLDEELDLPDDELGSEGAETTREPRLRKIRWGLKRREHERKDPES